MYKLFLCLKYLRKRALAYFAMFCVAQCVFMMLVCVSVLNGFVDKIEKAAKGLFGDVVISSASLGGLAHYDEFIGDIKRDVPEVEGASPFILTFGILRVPGTDYRRTVQIAGIRLPERADVSDFEEGLFIQRGLEKPTFDPPESLLVDRLIEEHDATVAILNRVSAAELSEPDSGKRIAVWVLGVLAATLHIGSIIWVARDSARYRVPTGWHSYSSDAALWVLFCILLWIGAFPYYLARRSRELKAREETSARRRTVTAVGLAVLVLWVAAHVGTIGVLVSLDEGLREDPSLPRRITNALSYQERAIGNLRAAERIRGELQRVRKELVAADEAGDDEAVARLERHVASLERIAILPPQRRAILGLGIPGLTNRTRKGETIRTIGPAQQVVLTLIPLGRGLSYTDITPNTKSFTVIDDCSTDVSSIDSEIVYVPFETLQSLNRMSAEQAEGDANIVVTPARCSQIHVKVKAHLRGPRKLQEIARRIDAVWEQFRRTHKGAADSTVQVETWRQRQSRLVSSIEAQRTLMIIILGIVSTVAVILIFVIMYVTVVQKTRDIGVLKAVGGSSGGVAGIFLGYGAAIALVGSVAGMALGYLFVRNINPIHDWIGRTFGLVVWSRETFMFEKIPNDVGVFSAVMIVIGAVLSGVLGSLVPAILAAGKQPVEALRYE